MTTVRECRDMMWQKWKLDFKINKGNDYDYDYIYIYLIDLIYPLNNIFHPLSLILLKDIWGGRGVRRRPED